MDNIVRLHGRDIGSSDGAPACCVDLPATGRWTGGGALVHGALVPDEV